MNKELDFYFQVKEKTYKDMLQFATTANYHLTHSQSLLNDMKSEMKNNVINERWNEIIDGIVEALDCNAITLRELSTIYFEQIADEWKNDER